MNQGEERSSGGWVAALAARLRGLFKRNPTDGAGIPGPVMDPPESARLEAKKNPGGWVYKLDGNYSEDDGVPNWAIMGCWKVDKNGCIVGSLDENPNYDPAQCRKRDLGSKK